MSDLTKEELHSLSRLAVAPRIDRVPDEHIERFKKLGLVTQVLGGQGWKLNENGIAELRKSGR
ncbi:hypothetical protein [Xanthomonas cannabis]|uniref:hypothetical protein n=1 Tax=Xanthomonas cannabis TaxID=1885674 RepID=UPI00141AF3DD|nr:hypothetical protein [Xanthomonas cannabis]NIK62630.1 hypothetical protein [Xanthomonas cannabis]